jgi:putative ABC transport system permease protein
MIKPGILAAKLKRLISREKPDLEFDREMREHLHLLTERYKRAGMSPADADSAARRQFGNTTLLQEERREMQTIPVLDALWRDVRYGARHFRLNPLFTIVTVVSLALGIGANAAVFTLLDQLVLRLLPVQHPERLVMIWSTGPHFGGNSGQRTASYPMYQDFQRKAEAFDFVFCRFETPSSITIDGGTERADAELVSGNYFQALGIRPALGRLFSPETDDRLYKGHPSVVLSYRYWLRRFSGDTNVLGKKILVNNYPMEIVGVSAAGFAGLDPARSPDIRVPILMSPIMTPARDDLGNRRSQWIQIFARLKPSYTVESARASLQLLFHQILWQEAEEPILSRRSQHDRNQFLMRTALVEIADTGYSGLRRQYSTALIVLMCMAAVTLVIACSNVAGLLVARGIARQKETAVRLAIGAGRKPLIRQLLVESVLLSLTGAGLGLVLSVAVAHGLLSMLPESGATLALHARPDVRILLFSTGLAFSTALLFGLIPALQTTKLDLLTALKNGASAASGGSATFRKALVTAQVALSLLLLVGSGLFARTLANLKNTHTGFENLQNLVSFQIDPAKHGYPAGRTRNFYTDALREIRAMPGVQSAGYVMWPVLNGREWDLTVMVEGHHAEQREDMQVYYNLVSPGYWRAMGIPLLRGRDFDERDRVDGGDDPQPWNVAIVNREFAEHFFGKQDPIGQHIGCCHGPDTTPSIRIVGVVENSLFGGPRAGVRRQVFLPYLESATPAAVTFYVRSEKPPAAIFSALRRVLAKLDGSVPVYDLKTLENQLDETLSTERLIAFLSTVFSVLATALAALGLYGVMAFVVARRTGEIGLRMALGAPRSWVLWLVTREILTLLAGGLILGIPSAYVLSRFISSQLFGVTPADLGTGATAVTLLALMALISGFVPARRASSIDPITALRYE